MIGEYFVKADDDTISSCTVPDSDDLVMIGYTKTISTDVMENFIEFVGDGTIIHVDCVDCIPLLRFYLADQNAHTGDFAYALKAFSTLAYCLCVTYNDSHCDGRVGDLK
jgi:hypothetical protein